jgi:hypothetical protein
MKKIEVYAINRLRKSNRFQALISDVRNMFVYFSLSECLNLSVYKRIRCADTLRGEYNPLVTILTHAYLYVIHLHILIATLYAIIIASFNRCLYFFAKGGAMFNKTRTHKYTNTRSINDKRVDGWTSEPKKNNQANHLSDNGKVDNPLMFPFVFLFFVSTILSAHLFDIPLLKGQAYLHNTMQTPIRRQARLHNTMQTPMRCQAYLHNAMQTPMRCQAHLHNAMQASLGSQAYLHNAMQTPMRRQAHLHNAMQTSMKDQAYFHMEYLTGNLYTLTDNTVYYVSSK